MSWFFFVLFIALPFIKYKGRPLFLFNIPEGKFIIFGKIFWPQDFFIFGLTMITFLVFIILFTAAFGRLFCGWVCPQTIFMEMLFRKIEYFIEGDAARQRVLANSPWTSRKLFLKTSKHLVFFLLSFITANIFLSYIIGVDKLLTIVTEPVSQHAGGFASIIIFSGVFYGVFAWFREQACTVVCPYGRLQSVLMDRNSMVVAYDYKRGEPRHKFMKSKPEEIRDCLDCFQCVHVCPTGIDIRNGTQMECVGCTACIDACNDMMEKTGRPLNLIRYASENGIEKGEKLRYTPRMKGYTALLVLLTGLLIFLLATRKDITATVIRTPGMLYQERGVDSITNLYSVKVVNKTLRNIPLKLKVEERDGAVEIIGHPSIEVKEEGQGTGIFFVVLARNKLTARKTTLRLGLYEGDRRIDIIKTSFLAPVSD